MSWERGIDDLPVVAVIRTTDPELARSMTFASIEAGATTIEITYTTPGASRLIRELSAMGRSDVVIGAGTVLTPAQADDAVAAGAEFLVSPSLDVDVAGTARDAGVPYVPGAYTPTEVLRALDEGSPLVKLFPASSHSPQYVKALTDVAPHLRLLPSGGIDAANAATWLTAGARAVCISGALNRAVAAGGLDALRTLVGQLVLDHGTRATTPSHQEIR